MVLGLGWWQIALAEVCGLVTGLAKTGLPGLGILVVPMMFFVVNDSSLSPGALLPMLCLADLFAVIYYRRDVDWRWILRMAPWVLCGVALGSLILPWVTRWMIGAIVLVMLIVHVVRKIRADAHIPHTWPVSLTFGGSAGFATTVANAAGPIMALFMLSIGMEKAAFMGTGAWFFFLINLLKVPLFVLQHRIVPWTLRVDLMVVPAIVIGAVGGRLIVRHINQKIFERVVLSLTVVATIYLFLPPTGTPPGKPQVHAPQPSTAAPMQGVHPSPATASHPHPP